MEREGFLRENQRCVFFFFKKKEEEEGKHDWLTSDSVWREKTTTRDGAWWLRATNSGRMRTEVWPALGGERV